MTTATIVREPEREIKVEERAPIIEIPVAPIAGELPGLIYPVEATGASKVILALLAVGFITLWLATLPAGFTEGLTIYLPFIP